MKVVEILIVLQDNNRKKEANIKRVLKLKDSIQGGKEEENFQKNIVDYQ